MLGTLKKSRSNDLPYKIEELIQSLSNEEDRKLFTNIYKKVTKKKHNNESPKKGDGTITECIELFNKGAAPNVLIELEKSLRKQEEYYNYYTKNFLPVLEEEVMKLKVEPSVSNNEIEQSQGSPTRRGKILKIISEIANKSSDKNHSSSTIQNQKSHQTDRQDNATGLFKKKNFPSEVVIAENSVVNALESDSLAKGVSGKGTPGIYNPLRSLDRYDASTALISKQLQERKEIAQSQLSSQSDLSIDSKDLKNEKPNITVNAVEVPSGANTSKLSSGNDSDSGINSSGLASSSRRSSLTSISSEESVHLKLNPAEEDNGLQLEDEGKTKLAHPNKTRPKGPSGRRSPSKYYKKTEEGPHCVISVTGSKVEDTMQSNNYENNSKIKNKNLHVALVTSSALLAIGCIVAGAMTSGLVGAGLFVVAAVFATAAAAEFCSNILSSKLTSISVSPLVDNKELTR
ncbi:hypothetical protein WSTR_01570 [Wolbachia endosymbiont of Laodelphax striatellus]|uniref:DUF350 domain-containing protein n=1 Tax=Wolbachia endosymbiont of Laodelphax striatellus TaxID=368602 RepID=UPI0007C462A0|nr:DUF350 domain-containing protein [Wolbachia endosymbiont of Laodelphax striatellus]OAB82281.1 hypothetical protein WSTR_01570 [Wolbachia endosymbiont of Laodelphax striatellus]